MENAAGDRERIYLYDNVRAILICLVVLGHAVQTAPYYIPAYSRLNDFIYSFHMPAFIFLAGMFHTNERVAPKAAAYVFISFLMSIVIYLANALFSLREPLYLFQLPSVPWFIFVLAGYTVLSYVLRDIDKRFLLLASLVLGCFSGCDQSLGDLFGVSRFIVFFPFYLLGQLFDRDRLAAVSRAPALRAAGAFILAGWLVFCLLPHSRIRPFFDIFGGNKPFDDSLYPWGPALRALHYALSFSLCLALISFTPDRRVPLVSLCGSRTLQIYFWHLPIVWHFNALTGLGSLFWYTRYGPVLWVLFCVVVTVVLATPPFSFPTAFILRAAGCRSRKQHPPA